MVADDTGPCGNGLQVCAARESTPLSVREGTGLATKPAPGPILLRRLPSQAAERAALVLSN
jgi:hypothetical protein